MKDRLRKFINHELTFIVVFILIITSIVLTVFEFLAPTPALREFYFSWGLIITYIFIIELSIRWYVADSFKQFSHDCWLDLLALLPIIRPLRVLRILRLLRLLGWGVRARRLRRMTILGTGLAENFLIVLILFVVFMGSTIGILSVETGNEAFDSFSEAAWWSILTLMAGEPILGEPTTTFGKLITALVMLGGFTLFAMFTGVVSAFMVRRLKDDRGASDLVLKYLKNHYIVCGWNRAAPSMIKELQANDETKKRDIVIISEQRPHYTPLRSMKLGDVFFVEDDYTSADVLNRVRVNRAMGAVILADKTKSRNDQDRDARSILTALTIEKMRQNDEGGIYSCVELLHNDQDKLQVLKDAQVEDVVEGDEFMGHLIAHSVHASGLIQVIDDLLTSTWGSEFQVVTVGEENTFGELLRIFNREQGLLVFGTLRDKMEMNSLSDTTDSLRSIESYGLFEINTDVKRRIKKGQVLIGISSPRERTLQTIPRKISSPQIPRPSPEVSHSQASTLENLNGHCVICGWNRAVPQIIKELRENKLTKDSNIVLISERETKTAELDRENGSGRVFHITGDYTSNKILLKARIEFADNAIIVADKSDPSRSDQDRDARSILAALTIKKRNPGIETCLELLNREEQKMKILQMARIENIVVGDEYLGNLIAQSTRTPSLAQAMAELLTSNEGNEFCKEGIEEEGLKKMLVDEEFTDVLVFYKEHYNALIVAIETFYPPELSRIAEGPGYISSEKADRPYYLTNPPPFYKIKEGDRFFVIRNHFR